MLAPIKEKISQLIPIDRQEAAWLYQNASLQDLSELATSVKQRYHPADTATYLIMAIVNYTNICVARCDFCAFYRLPHEKGGYLLSTEEVFAKIDQTVDKGGTLISFNGGFHPKLHLEHYAELFQQIHQRYPKMTFFEMTVAEFMFSCKISKLSYDEGVRILKEAGTRWITGGGSEILEDNFRFRHSPGKFKVADYYAAQRAVLAGGLGSTATMVIGFDETLEERLSHLESLRAFQDAGHEKLTSFLCWSYKPYHTSLGGQEISDEEYLRWLAISRIYLQNFEHIRTSVLTKNEQALLGLKYGANDFDLPLEDEVTQKAGAIISQDLQAILNYAHKLGYKTLHREPFKKSYALA
jgi:cyclic dehypoxanthinyl futalosine synthase